MVDRMCDVLTTELETYRRYKDRLVEEHSGEYVLIHGDGIAGIFKTEREALSFGYKTYGYVPMLVKEIAPVEIPLYIA